ncbi:MAG TPA: 30S ribosomal protein S1 [Terriglobales bacterium]|nr:30S ribosomal protein S1 [Terriglobales bacterium]
MSNPSIPESQLPTETSSEPTQSFDEIFSQYEQSHSRHREDPGKQIEGTVIAVSAESVFIDIGFKSEGLLPLTAFQSDGKSVKPGDKLLVSVKGRDLDGYYQLSRTKIAQPTDWSSLEQAFAEKATIVGTVTGVVKGGLSVDVGVRAFMPASRSGVRDTAEMEKLVGQEIRCRITKLDSTDEDVVVDRRVISEEEDRSAKERRYSEIAEGETVNGTVRSVTDYGAFVDLGGIDGLLHVSDISWGRINKPADLLSVGQQIDVKVLKVSEDSGKRRISVGMKQLQPHPWDSLAGKYKMGDRIRGVVTRVVEFGAFVELEPGIEGLIHVSEMSWAKKVRIASDVVKPGETVDAVILGINSGERRIALGLKQTLGDPWVEAGQKFAVGTVIEGPVTSITKFGAFVQLAEGVEGMIHVSEISDKRIHHPQDVLRVGQVVKAQVLEIDKAKRQLRLSIKQMIPTSLDEYLAEHKVGDLVTGRVVEVSDGSARAELGEGIQCACHITKEAAANQGSKVELKADVSSLSSMLAARWKGGAGNAASGEAKPKAEAVRAGQVRNFRITTLDPDAKKIEVELA